jgi:hypothetical protein
LERVLLRLLVLKAASGVDTPRKRKRLVSCERDTVNKLHAHQLRWSDPLRTDFVLFR